VRQKSERERERGGAGGELELEEAGKNTLLYCCETLNFSTPCVAERNDLMKCVMRNQVVIGYAENRQLFMRHHCTYICTVCWKERWLLKGSQPRGSYMSRDIKIAILYNKVHLYIHAFKALAFKPGKLY
jgi:hypothetical protein